MKFTLSINLLLLLAALLAPAQSPNEPAPAQIEGTVASTVEGKLLPRARVFLRSKGQKDDYVTWSEADDNGHFLFTDVAAGTYELLAEKSGFFADTQKSPVPAVDVKVGDQISGVVIRLVPLAALAGRVVNEHDDPVQDAQVRLLSREYLHGREFLNNAAVVATDDRGEYRIFAIHPGRYYLVVEYDAKKAHANPFPGLPVKGAPAETAYPPLFFPFTSDLREAQRITVAAGDELHYDFAFVSVPSVSMEGRVLNGMTGAPVKALSIMAYWGDKMSGITRKVDVNPKGDFKLDGIEPGPYTLIASAVENGENYYDLRVLEVGVAGLKDVQLALMPDFTANGEVKFENPEDRPQDSLPRRVSVEFMPMETNTGPFRVNADQQVQSRGASGSGKGRLAFAAKLHPGNSYRVSIVNLPQDYYLRSVLVDGHEVSASDVAIRGNGSELVLLASPAGGHIEGIVRDSKGQPVAGHVVLAANVDQLTPDLVRSVRSDRQGKFALRGVSPGDYKLYAWEQLDLNELLGQLDLLKEFEGECQLVHVDENGTYNPEIKVIAAK